MNKTLKQTLIDMYNYLMNKMQESNNQQQTTNAN